MRDARQELSVVTGSRIPQRLDRRSCLPATASPVVVYPGEALLRGGAPNVAEALARPVPAPSCER